MNDEYLYLIALTRVLPYQSQVQHQLLDAAGSATALFEVRHRLREAIPEANERLAAVVAQMELHLARAEEEMAFARKNRIALIHRTDDRYPARLRQCPDAPVLLYYRGTADLNPPRTLSIVGTRHATDYGRTFCQTFLRDLAHLCPGVLVVSGLAYGIDIQAHRHALQQGLPTVAVLAHGLDQIYPRMHRQTAIDMLSRGGLLTEYISHTVPDKVNFVARNRIVAGMADATLVVESARKGGSLITARIANEYDREVFAVPGRVGDVASEGCNHLIARSRATLVQSAAELVEVMGWASATKGEQPVQGELFPQLTAEEEAVCRTLKGSEGKSLNQLTTEANLPVGQLASLLFDLEMRGLVRQLSGGLYRLLWN